MKRIINILISTAVMVLAGSCIEQAFTEPEVVAGSERIVLSFSSGATKAGAEVESYLNHVDVMIFEYGTEPGILKYYERIMLNGSSTSVLQAQRSSFGEGTGYYIQVLANSTASSETLASIEDYSQLINMKQEDIELHLTGLDVDQAPDFFLMDGVAYSGTSKPSVPGSVVLNNGVSADDTNLQVTLERAAAKVEVIINAGNTSEFEINFADGLENTDGALYYLRNMPYDTFVIDHDPNENTRLVTTYRTKNKYFDWNPSVSPQKVSLVTYVYPHLWKDQSILEKEPCVIMNLPFVYTDKISGTDHKHPNSWYKIPMSPDAMFDRNMYYKVEITINRAGATTMLEPVTVGETTYSVGEWTDVLIPVGGEDSKPKYLTVNRETMDMNNIDTDDSTLEFSSSSEIVSCTIDKVWFIDKFGAEQNITSSNHGIKITPDNGLNGNITVYSPKPTNNTTRFITFTITNEDGDSRSVTVAQNPLEYITNTVSWYSYRSDFIGSGQSVPTTYENLSSSNNVTSISYTGKDTSGKDTYRYNTGNTAGFFRSKVAVSTYATDHDRESYRGRSDIDSYYWRSGRNHGDIQDPGNARMYHIRIMASSGDYILGKPKITDGITDSGEDNALLVSPSFMIASRLAVITVDNIDLSDSQPQRGNYTWPTEPDPEDYGAVRGWFGWNWDNATDEQRAEYEVDMVAYEAEYEIVNQQYQADLANYENETYLNIYAEHCKQYVEVYDPDNDPDTDNAIHYDDWRLPTAAELGIIYKYQGSESESADAIDYLLNAGAYFSASGPVVNPSNNTDGTSVRCIRDAY